MSPVCADTVRKMVTSIRSIQAFIIVSQTCFYGWGITLVLHDPRVRPDMLLAFAPFLLGFVVGSFQLCAMIVAVVSSCEILDDRATRLAERAATAITAEQLHEVYLSMVQLDATLQRAVVVLRPIVLTVIAFNACISGCLVAQGIEGVKFPGIPLEVELAFLFGTATVYWCLAIFGILRSPFRLTKRIDVLNTALNQQRERVTRFGSASSDGGGSEISLGDQLDRMEDVNPEQTHVVHRVRRVQWLMAVEEFPNPVSGSPPTSGNDAHQQQPGWGSKSDGVEL